MYEIAARIESHYKFSSEEFFELAMTSLVIALGLTISSGWGVFNLIKDQSLIGYLINFIVIFIFSFVALFIHFSAQKITALKLGYKATFRYWLNGFLISTVICFVTFGYIPLFFTGVLDFKVEKKLRMGRFRDGIMHSDLGWISFAGPFASMVMAMLCAPVYIASKNSFLFCFIVLNLLVAIYSLLPIPVFEKIRQFRGGMTGLYLFIANRWVFTLIFGTVFVYAALILIAKVFSVVLALLLGILVAAIYYHNFENKLFG